MSIFQKLFSFFRIPAASSEDHSYRFTVQCHRCGEQIPGRVDLRNDLSPEYDGGDTPSGYTSRKVLIGSGENLCFQSIEVNFQFDTNRKLVEEIVSGGKLLKP